MYGCDCDGVKREPLDRGRDGEALRGTLVAVERVTGSRPATCPWRSFYEPIVKDVLSVAWAIDPANLAVALGPDPDAKTVQAIGIYRLAKLATTRDEETLRAEEREQERRAKAALSKSRGSRG